MRRHSTHALDLADVDALASEAPRPRSAAAARASVTAAINGAAASPVVSRLAAERLVRRALNDDEPSAETPLDAADDEVPPWRIAAISRG
jgi:hypothetical protein